MKYLFSIIKGFYRGYVRGSILPNTNGFALCCYERHYCECYGDSVMKYDRRTFQWRAIKFADKAGARFRLKITNKRIVWGLALTTCNDYTLKGTFKLAIKKLVCKATGRDFQMEFNI